MTQTSTPQPALVFPPGRYGRRREPVRRRWPVAVASSVVIVIMVLIAVKLYRQYGSEEFSPVVLSYSQVSATSITVTFTVHKDGGAAATCTLNALAADGSQVGTAEVPVPAGVDVTVTYTMATTARPYVAEVPTCQAAS